ncbi:MAG: TetR/AcrR family transcriptional regulator [Desulfobulbaceae bacterium]|nr:TetR/AcrR family transcriptional regulator [Desulfobulbaceae bacterium]
MTRRDDSKAETRELILNSARSLFWEKGPDKCSVRDIAKEAGVSPASIIVHFKNKTALLEVALYEEIEKTLGKALASLPSDQGLQAVLMHIVSIILPFYDKNRELYRVLIRDTFFEPIQESPSLAQLDENFIQFIVTLINQEKKMGNFRSDIDSHLAASSLFYLYLGVLRNFLRNPNFRVAEAVDTLSKILNLHLAGI